MKKISGYLRKGEDGYKPTPIHFGIMLAIVFGLSFTPLSCAAEESNTLASGELLTSDQEWYLVRDVCYHNALSIATEKPVHEIMKSYSGTYGVALSVVYNREILYCDNILSQGEGSQQYEEWLEFAYSLAYDRHDAMLEDSATYDEDLDHRL